MSDAELVWVDAPSPAGAHQARKRWADNPFECDPVEFEIECRKHADGTSSVYARFVGALEIGERVPDPESDGEPQLGDSVDSARTAPQEPAPVSEPLGDSDAAHSWTTFSAVTERPIDGDEEDEDAEEAAYQEQVGVIDGVCGPCRRLRCFLCVLPGCKCARPNHGDRVRSSA